MIHSLLHADHLAGDSSVSSNQPNGSPGNHIRRGNPRRIVISDDEQTDSERASNADSTAAEDVLPTSSPRRRRRVVRADRSGGN